MRRQQKPDPVALLREAIGDERGAQKSAAERLACDEGQLSRILSRKRRPNLDLALAIERAFPTVRVQLWEAA